MSVDRWKIVEEKSRRALLFSLGGITGIGVWESPDPCVIVYVKDEESKELVEAALLKQLGELRQIDGRVVEVKSGGRSTPVLY